MTPRLLLQVLVFTLTLASGAMAQGYADDVVQQLKVQGYADISVETTFLGRVRIVAAADGGHREIILNPRTGEILRDLWIVAGGAAPKVTIVDHSGSGSGSGSGSDGDNSGSGGDGGSGGGDDNGGSGNDGGGDDNSGSGDGDSSGSGSGSDDKNDDSGGDRDGPDRDRSND